MKKILLFSFLCFFSISIFGQSKEEVLRELQRQKIPCSKIVLGQAILESGNFQSNIYKNNKNLFGIKIDGKYQKYSSWRESIKDYKIYFSDRYTGGSYYLFLERIKYARDKEYIIKLKKVVKYL